MTADVMTVKITTRRSDRLALLLRVTEMFSTLPLSADMADMVLRLDDLVEAKDLVEARDVPGDDLCVLMDLTPRGADWLADFLALVPGDMTEGLAKEFAPGPPDAPGFGAPEGIL